MKDFARMVRMVDLATDRASPHGACLRHGGKPLVSLVTPVYCEEGGIEEFYARAKAMLDGLAAKYDHEIIFVNDGSTDRTLDILLQIADCDRRVHVVDLSRNFGHQMAITAGIDFAAGDAVVIIDSDLQDPPEVVPAMVDKWEEGFKVVYGVRKRREGEGRFKRATASAFYRVLQWMSDTKLPLDAGDFRLIDRAVADVVKNMREEHRYLRGIMAWAGFTQFALPYCRDPRFAGETKYPLMKMVRLAVNAIVSFSARPLYAAMYLGVFVTLLSLAWLAWIVIGKLIAPAETVPGWSSLTVLVLFLGGVQLTTTGILGQYVGRIFEQSKHRPLYVVSETYGFAKMPGSTAAKEAISSGATNGGSSG